MSTTRGTKQGTLYLLDPPDALREEGHVTPSRTPAGRSCAAPRSPGSTNLIDIMSVATGDAPEAIEARYDGQGYGPFKEDVAESVIASARPDPGPLPRARRPDEAELQRRLLAVSADKAREASAPTLEAMYDRMGFVRP